MSNRRASFGMERPAPPSRFGGRIAATYGQLPINVVAADAFSVRPGGTVSGLPRQGPNVPVMLYFEGATTFVHSAQLVLSAGANYTTVAGEAAWAIPTASGWAVFFLYLDIPLAQLPTTREKLAASRTYYVRTDGSDSNAGLANTAGGAFLTIQKAINVVLDTLDLAGFGVLIQVEDGTYTGGVNIPYAQVGQGIVTIQGDTGTPANCIISTTSDDCFRIEGGIWAIDGFKLQTTTSGNCLMAMNGDTKIYHRNINYGACAGVHIDVSYGATVSLFTNYTISGGAGFHYHCPTSAQIVADSITVTLSGTPAFSSAFAATTMGYMDLGHITFSGAATGIRYLAHRGGVISVDTTSLTFLPGNAAGVLGSGGKYVGDDTLIDVIGPATTVDNTIPRNDGTTGKLQTSGVVIADSNEISLARTSAGAKTIGLHLQNASDTASTEIAIDLNPSTQVGATRSAQISAVAEGSSVIRLSLKASGNSGAAPVEVMYCRNGVVVGAPTGGDPGVGNINAKDVLNDNVSLTCFALQEQYLRSGKVDLDFFDSTVPPTVEPARIERRPVLEEVDVERIELNADPEKGGYVASRVRRVEFRQTVDLIPIYDDEGNGLDAIAEPMFDEVRIPETVTLRKNEVAHLFQRMLDDGFDPRAPGAYRTKLLADQALPAMPLRGEWQHNRMGTGELFCRLWLATELLALALMQLEERVATLESAI